MDDVEELKALAEKLMTHPHPEGPTSIELLVRRRPADGAAIPIPPGTELLGSALHSRRGNPTQIEAIYKAEGDAQSVLGRYEVALKAGDWGVFAGYGGMHGGFVPGGLPAAYQSDRPGDGGPPPLGTGLGRGAHETEPRPGARLGTGPPPPPRRE